MIFGPDHVLVGELRLQITDEAGKLKFVDLQACRIMGTVALGAEFMDDAAAELVDSWRHDAAGSGHVMIFAVQSPRPPESEDDE